MNGLAGIAIIQGELSEAESLYKEALALAEQNSEDFRLDPLLNLHIHYNLAEVLNSASNDLQRVPFFGTESSGIPEDKHPQIAGISKCDGHIAKKRKVMREDSSEISENVDVSSQQNCNCEIDGLKSDQRCDAEPHSSHTTSADSLTNVCESIKRKYLSIFYSRLSQSQQEFQKSYAQV